MKKNNKDTSKPNKLKKNSVKPSATPPRKRTNEAKQQKGKLKK